MRRILIVEARELRDKVQINRVRRLVALLGDDDLGFGLVGLRHFLGPVVLGLAMDEGHHIGVLLNRSDECPSDLIAGCVALLVNER
jgi:hypothetical protein